MRIILFLLSVFIINKSTAQTEVVKVKLKKESLSKGLYNIHAAFNIPTKSNTILKSDIIKCEG